MRKFSRLVVLAIAVSFCATTLPSSGSETPSAEVQIPDASQSDPIQPGQQFPGEDKAPKSEAEKRAEQQMEKARQKQRWDDIRKRSEQLLEVATELKQYVDKSGENVMSIEVIRKAEQMEKLAKDLQKKMKGN